MFTSLIFLILVLLLSNFAIEVQGSTWFTDPWLALFIGLLFYGAVLIFIALQNKWTWGSKERRLFLANLELLSFLSIILFFFGLTDFLQKIPFLGLFGAFLTFVPFVLYLGGLWIFYATSRPKEGFDQIRLITPFALPFLFFLFCTDLLRFFPLQNEFEGVGYALLIVALILIFFPPLVIVIWGCSPMQDSPLKERLECLCRRAGFKHGGILDWTILNRTLTAAIIGIIPRFRYILMTRRLQAQLSADSLEAVLAHEIGHNARRHLLYFPLIFLGLGICFSLYAIWLSPFVESALAEYSLLAPFAVFIPYAFILALFFRFVFGFFSRLFERQADLHTYELQLPPQHMIKALDDVALATGSSHTNPNWHHYSIQQRMNFLESCIENPNLIKKHHRKVKWALAIYGGLLALATYTFFT